MKIKKVNKNYYFCKFCSMWKMIEIDRWRYLYIDILCYCIENKMSIYCI